MITEAQLQIQVAGYIRLRHPDVLFHSDYGSGIKLTMNQARIQKHQNGGRRAWPDIFIAEPIGISSGLFIELKREGVRILKKDGALVADAHIREQYDLLCELEARGYKAFFAVGFEQAQYIIDSYLAGRLGYGHVVEDVRRLTSRMLHGIKES